MNTARLKTFFYGLSKPKQEEFAKNCGTSVGQIQQIIYSNRSCNPSLAINFERESGGLINCDDLCPHVDFAFLRNTKPKALAV